MFVWFYACVFVRFVYLRRRRDQSINHTHAQVEKALDNIREGKEIVDKLRVSLEHEQSVLEGRMAGTIALMSQIGQDKAIARQQLMVLYKQHDKMINLKRVRFLLTF